MNKKPTYQPPCIELIAMQNQGSVMAASLEGMGGTDFISNTPVQSGTIKSKGSAATKSANPMQELEDMLNDLFTITK